jgi:hypothetical protein
MWTHEANIYGCRIRAAFFDGDKAEVAEDFFDRNFPILSSEQRETIELLTTEEDKKNFRTEKVVAQPDAVLLQSSSLIHIPAHRLCLEYKSNQKKKHAKNKWTEQIRVKDILQCVINAIQVSSVENSITVPLLKYHNVIYLIDPSEELCDLIMNSVDAAIIYNDEKKDVSSSQLAGYLESKVRSKYQVETEASRLGKEMHEKMLRR